MRIGTYSEEVLRDSVAGLEPAARSLAIRDIAKQLNCSAGYLYRIAKRVGLTGKKTARKDAGERRIELTEEVEIFMEGLTLQADLSADHVLFVTARHFGLPQDFMSTATYNAWLRQERISRRDNVKDLRPYRSHLWRDKANALHQYDTTVALAFYANDDGSIGCEPGYERYKNKPGNRRPRLHLYSLTDYYSSTTFARFYFSENSLNLLDFVFRAWSEKNDPCFPFYGIPDDLYCDQGAPRKSAKFVNAAAKLGVKILDTDPAHWTEHGSRKFGRVERTFGEGLLKEFMKLTKIFRFTSIDELNDTLWHYLIRMNNKIHRTHKEARFARWLRTAGTPRCMPSEEMFKLLHYERAERTVARNLQIQLNGKIFQLPYRKPFINWVDARIECYWYPGHEDAVTVAYDFHEEEIKALAPVVEMVAYQSVPRTDREDLAERLKQQKYSSVNFPAIYRADKDLPYLPRKGEAFDESKIAEKTVVGADGKERPGFTAEKQLKKFEIIVRLRSHGLIVNSPPSGAERLWVESILRGREEIAESELNRIVSEALERDLAEEG